MSKGKDEDRGGNRKDGVQVNDFTAGISIEPEAVVEIELVPGLPPFDYWQAKKHASYYRKILKVMADVFQLTSGRPEAFKKQIFPILEKFGCPKDCSLCQKYRENPCSSNRCYGCPLSVYLDPEQKILIPGTVMEGCVKGYYENNFEEIVTSVEFYRIGIRRKSDNSVREILTDLIHLFRKRLAYLLSVIRAYDQAQKKIRIESEK